MTFLSLPGKFDEHAFSSSNIRQRSQTQILRSALLDLAWYQYFLLDIIAAIALVLGSMVLIVAYSCQLELCWIKYVTAVDVKKTIKY